jgi:penicillin-binding protein 1B
LEPRVQDAAEQAVAATLDRIEIDRKLPRGDLEAAVLVANNQTGEISAVVGGRKAGFQGFNSALNARRPVGSLLKPVVYLTALENVLVPFLPKGVTPELRQRGVATPWEPQTSTTSSTARAARASAGRLAQPRDGAPW